MLIALLSDIHGNREALEACLDHARRSRVDGYMFLGDYVGYGADPAWVLDAVMAHVERGALALLGNHDEAAIGSGEGMSANARIAIEWTRDRLDAGHRRFLAGLPLAIEDGERLFVHANAWAPGDWDYVTGPLEAERSLGRTRSRTTFCGHVHAPAMYHMKADQRGARPFRPVAGCAVPLLAQRRWLAVIGAVGQPRDGDPDACYALLNHERNELAFVRVPYDVEGAARKIVRAGLPPRLAARLHEGR